MHLGPISSIPWEAVATSSNNWVSVEYLIEVNFAKFVLSPLFEDVKTGEVAVANSPYT